MWTQKRDDRGSTPVNRPYTDQHPMPMPLPNSKIETMLYKTDTTLLSTTKKILRLVERSDFVVYSENMEENQIYGV